jgi:phosphatidylglycerophosphatase C
VNGTIAFFDFDGTITIKDSLLEFIKYCKGRNAYYLGFALHTPVLAAYKLNIISNQRAKEIMLRYFFGKMNMDVFIQCCANFSEQIIPSLIRPKALQEIDKLKAAGAGVVIVSASPEYWLQGWCDNIGVKCIATRLLTAGNKLTGKIDGINCYGEEKVNRIKKNYDLDTFSSVYCYGDTPGDKPMLALGTIRFYKPFR